MSINSEKARESRPRRQAARHGLLLRKSRARDPRVWWAGTYGLSDAHTTALVAGCGATANGYGLDLDDVEAFIAESA
jgi:hypothetical protein